MNLARNASGLIGLTLMALLILTALLGPFLDLPNPTRTDMRARMSPPTLSLGGPGLHPLGTDQLGRDILSRMVQGSRVTLLVAGAAVAIGGLVGIGIGLVCGYFGGILDRLMMRFIDMQQAVPLILLALLIIAALGPSLQNLVLVLALTSWLRYARIVRGQVLAVKQKEFVRSALAIGAGPIRILLSHILPNVLAPALVVATLELARVIVLEAGLSFIGLGIQPPWPSWGRMLADGRPYAASAWWIITLPGVALVLTVLSVNLVGDWLRDRFDPRLRH